MKGEDREAWRAAVHGVAALSNGAELNLWKGPLLFNILQGFFPSINQLILIPYSVSTERPEGNRSVSSVSSYVTSFLICKMSPQFPHLQNGSSNPCLTRAWRRIKWDTSHEALGPMFDTHAHSINIYPFTFFSPSKIESVLRILLPRLNDNIFPSFPSFQTLNSVPTSSSLLICSSAHCNLASPPSLQWNVSHTWNQDS